MAPGVIQRLRRPSCRKLLYLASLVLSLTALMDKCVVGAAASSLSFRGNRAALQRFEGPKGNDFRMSRGGARFELPIAGRSARPTSSYSGSSFRRLADVPMNSSGGQEVDALIAFKAAISSDPLNALTSWRANDSDACSWSGVRCSSQSPQHVVALDLASLELSGDLTVGLQQIGSLSFLEQLDLSANNFFGSIPTNLANCSRLSTFNMSFNKVAGNIPFQLGNLANLQVFDVLANNLTGEVPASLGNCSLLTYLSVTENQLSGVIPPALGQLSNLQYLDMSGNYLSGSVPSALGNCSSLTTLELSENPHLGGLIPPELSQLTNLEIFVFQVCSFEGSFPSWVVNLTALTVISLAYNLDIQGELPDDIGKLSNLQEIYITSNNITGPIPTSITNLTSLTYVILQENMLTGEIPITIGSLQNLIELSVSFNNLTGFIPSSLANISNLSSLQLDDNILMANQSVPSWIVSLPNMAELDLSSINLQGELPVEIGKLGATLNWFRIVDNNLKGTIPDSFENCTLLESLEVSDNQLTGTIPSGLGVLTQLIHFGVGSNHLTGPLPASVWNFSQLQSLDITENALQGEIDSSIGKLSQLIYLWADTNKLSGFLPEELGNCSALTQIWLYENMLTGEIPSSLGNLTSLEALRLENNQFRGVIPTSLFVGAINIGELRLDSNLLEGTIPAEIGQLVSMYYFSPNDNNFSGTMPTSLGNCTDMMHLDLSSNNFEGSIPGLSIRQMFRSLQYLNLSHNHFSGPWPPQFSSLANILAIDVSENNISGSIPPGLGGCATMQSLDISLNNLSGEIPQDLASLKFLTFINVSYNNFVGPIPDAGVFNLSNVTIASFLGEPLLCGGKLGACNSTPATQNHSSHSCHGFKCKKILIPTITAIVIVIIVVGTRVGLSYWTAIHRHEKSSGNASGQANKMDVYLQIQNSPVLKEDVMRAIGMDEGDPIYNIIGVGSKSTVYKGTSSSREGQYFFAVKLLIKGPEDEDEPSGQRQSEITREVEILSGLRHRNILKVLSYFSGFGLGKEAIILEYMPRGSLHDHLHGDGVCDLPWDIRFKIAKGVAEGMAYLHHHCSITIIHRDLKPRNILLDADFEPKIGDFGVSKWSGASNDGEITASTFCGTVGYLPPEYAMGTSVSTKGDVFSYGMVLLELLTLRQPGDSEEYASRGDLRQWVLKFFQDQPFELLDPALQQELGAANPKLKDQMTYVLRVGLLCTGESPKSRPTMIDVIAMLSQIKEMGSEPLLYRTTSEIANDLTTSEPQGSFEEGTRSTYQ